MRSVFEVRHCVYLFHLFHRHTHGRVNSHHGVSLIINIVSLSSLVRRVATVLVFQAWIAQYRPGGRVWSCVHTHLPKELSAVCMEYVFCAELPPWTDAALPPPEQDRCRAHDISRHRPVTNNACRSWPLIRPLRF